jgi:hypothetical protein
LNRARGRASKDSGNRLIGKAEGWRGAPAPASIEKFAANL